MSLTKVPVIGTQKMKQVQKVMDLDTGNEGAEITLEYVKYTVPTYTEKEFGGTEAEFEQAILEAASNLVQPVSAQILALTNKATQDEYQNAKATALATGNFLSTDLKGRIVQVMRGNQAYQERTAKECFDLWKAGFMAKKPGAVKVLDIAKTIGDFDLD